MNPGIFFKFLDIYLQFMVTDGLVTARKNQKYQPEHSFCIHTIRTGLFIAILYTIQITGVNMAKTEY